MDCNPRQYASQPQASAAGVNFVSLGLDLADGRLPDVIPHLRHEVVCTPGAAARLVGMSRWAGVATRGTARMLLTEASECLSGTVRRDDVHLEPFEQARHRIEVPSVILYDKNRLSGQPLRILRRDWLCRRLRRSPISSCPARLAT